MYESLQLFCKSLVFAGVFALSVKSGEGVSSPSQFTIDGLSYAGGVSLSKQQISKCKQSSECSKMAEAVYHESRSEGWEGMSAVANVIKNRVESSKFRNSVKEVVERPHQFSYMKEVKDKSFKDNRSYRKALLVSYKVLTGEIKDNTMSATHYVAPKKLKRTPRWVREFERTVVINDHVFYRG